MLSALHPRASYWIRQGIIFDDLRSFEAFEARVGAVWLQKWAEAKKIAPPRGEAEFTIIV
jgi:hypothetical protein